MTFLLNSLLNGLGIGALYALIAVGFVLIYKATKVLNFAHGNMVMMAGYFGVLFLNQLKLPIPLALVLALLMAALLGWAINRLLMRPMIGQPVLATVTITIALAWILDSLVTAIWGYETWRYPSFLPKGVISIGAITASKEMIWFFVIAMLLLLALTRFFATREGLAMRATAEDTQVVQASGISVKQIFSMTWILVGLLCGIAGILMADMLGASRGLSFIALKGLPAALIGGLESLSGAVAAGLLIGVAESVAAGYLDPILRGGTGDIFTFVLMLIIISIKPYGLFGLKRIERI